MKQINIKVDERFYEMAKSKADDMSVSMSELIRCAVQNFSTNGKESVHNAPTDGTEGVVEKMVEALHNELETKNRQIESLASALDHAQQLTAMAQKQSERLSDRLEAIEDMRQRPWWRRAFSKS